jgi:hypothetical protein
MTWKPARAPMHSPDRIAMTWWPIRDVQRLIAREEMNLPRHVQQQYLILVTCHCRPQMA